VFRSARREIVFPQAEHARLAATIAVAWGNDRLAPAPLPHESFVAGVALHDRGYAPLDADGIGEVSSERWLEIQRESFRPRNDDPVVDLVVAMHVRRLLRYAGRLGAADELTDAVRELRERAGVSEPDAEAADLITNMCDRIAFDFCFEEPADGALDLPAHPPDEQIRVTYRIAGEGGVTVDPWPLGVPRLAGVLFAFDAAGYPDELVPRVVPYALTPAGAS
jgi:hypothetical protein